MAYKNFCATCQGAADINFMCIRGTGSATSLSELNGIYKLQPSTTSAGAEHKIWTNTDSKMSIRSYIVGQIPIAIARQETNENGDIIDTIYLCKRFDTSTKTATTLELSATALKIDSTNDGSNIVIDMSSFITSKNWTIAGEKSPAVIYVANIDTPTDLIPYTRTPTLDISYDSKAPDWSAGYGDYIFSNTPRYGYGWRNAAGTVLYTKTDIPVENVTALQRSTDPISADPGLFIAKYEPPVWYSNSHTTKTTTYSTDPSLAIWKDNAYSTAYFTITYEGAPVLLAKAANGKEIATVVTEIYNPTKANANVTLSRYSPTGEEVFSYTIGVQPTEVLAIDHKYLIPEGYSMAVSSTVAGVRVCVNAMESMVIL